ncbi:MAG: ammonium transporter [Halothiobacillaceae bacterium]
METVTQAQFDTLWILVAAALVMFMQAGFTALESGLTRAKNTANVALKNLTDFLVSVLIFWLVGYTLMFEDSLGGFLGLGPLMPEPDTPGAMAFLVFQAVFAGTAATIVSGAVAERMKFLSYALVALVVVALIYPISGHWVWNESGWLAQMGFIDFAGSTVVHSLGAWVGLAGTLLIGPRIGLFGEDGKAKPIRGHNLVLAVMGVLILWFGWFGFNGGSTLSGGDAVAGVIANTLLAAAAGGLACFFTSLAFHDRNLVSVEKLLNGVIGGLVAITACAHLVSPGSAVLIGLIAGVVVYLAELLLLHVLRIDDPINVVAAHGFAGAWGTLAVAFFSTAPLPAGTMLAQAGVQALGVLAVFGWGFGMGLLLFGILKAVGKLRVSAEAEQEGLNVSEHGATNPALDMQRTMQAIMDDGDLTRRVEVETGSETEPLARMFNHFLAHYESAIGRLAHSAAELAAFSENMRLAGSRLTEGARSHEQQTLRITDSIDTLVQAVESFSQQVHQTHEQATDAQAASAHGAEVVHHAETRIQNLSGQVTEVCQGIEAVAQDSSAISKILETIEAVSEQTNLLALNAAIEAARAGTAGRGFAVVAEEVRNLSMATKGHASEIRQNIERLQNRVDDATQLARGGINLAREAVDAVRDSGAAFARIAERIEAINGSSGQMAQLAETQFGVVDTVRVGNQAIAEVTRETGRELDDLASLGGRVSTLSDQLSAEVAQYNARTLH